MTAPVLVVDDEPDAREMLAAVLADAGFDVATAANGRAALDEARRRRPCIILLDLMMPIMDGEQFRGLQQHDPDLQHVPVVVLSARHDAAAVADRLGVRAFAPKPLDFDRVLELVAACCQ
jgi:DNA-binding response OmpR family regulator